MAPVKFGRLKRKRCVQGALGKLNRRVDGLVEAREQIVDATVRSIFRRFCFYTRCLIFGRLLFDEEIRTLRIIPLVILFNCSAEWIWGTIGLRERVKVFFFSFFKRCIRCFRIVCNILILQRYSNSISSKITTLFRFQISCLESPYLFDALQLSSFSYSTIDFWNQNIRMLARIELSDLSILSSFTEHYCT